MTTGSGTIVPITSSSSLRASMSSLISALRGFTNAGTVDYTIAGVSFFTDAQLQTILDRYDSYLREMPLTARSITNTSGDIEYKEYETPARWLESTDSGGSARFVVTDGLGVVQGTALWSADYENGLITFVNDQAGSARYLTCHSYDIYAAAADVWGQKAAAYATMIDFSTDNHTIKRSHIVAQCEAMQKRYQGMAVSFGGSSSVDIVRGDSNE